VPPGCHLQVSSIEDFSSPVLDLDLPTPSTTARPATDLDDCEVCCWRVAATNGGVDGPFSVVNYFSVNVGATCTQACTQDQLVAPQPVWPPHYANVGTAPTEGLVPGLRQWWYAMPCFPEGFGSTFRPWLI